MKLRMAVLIQAVFAMVVAVSLSFGAKQVFASEGAAMASCPAKGYDYPYSPCASGCAVRRGYCDANGNCQCGDLP
jgi:hypothetical protein